MANAQYLLTKIKINGIFQDLITKTTGKYVTVTNSDGQEVSLADVLTSIFLEISKLPTDASVDTKIDTAKKAVEDKILGGIVPETMDTIKEIYDYTESHKEVGEALNAAINGKVDKDGNKVLSTNDFTNELKEKLEGTQSVTAEEKTAWNAKAETTVATAEANGLMSKEDKARFDGMGDIHISATQPTNMKNGDIWIQIIEPTTPTTPDTPAPETPENTETT